MSKINLTPTLEAVLIGAIEGIKTYESDTFSWAAGGAPYVQAEDVLAELISRCLFDAEGCPGSAIDGITMGYAVDEMIEDVADRIINESMP